RFTWERLSFWQCWCWRQSHLDSASIHALSSPRARTGAPAPHETRPQGPTSLPPPPSPGGGGAGDVSTLAPRRRHSGPMAHLRAYGNYPPAGQINHKVVARRERTPVPKGYWTIWSTVALDLVGFGIIVPILGRYAERFGASGLTVGLLFASFSLASLLMAPVLGYLSDRIGRKPVIIISLIGTAVGSFITGA